MSMRTVKTLRSRTKLGAVVGLGCAVSMVALAACGTSPGAGSGNGPIPIGMLGPLTGPAGFAGQGIVDGAAVAIDAINAAGGVMGRKLTLIPGDDHLDPVDAITVAQHQISINHIVATIGPAANTLTATQRYYDAAHVPVIMWGGDDEFGPITDPLIWRCTPGDSQEGTAMALYAYKAGYRHPAFFFGTDANGATLGAAVRKAWIKLAGQASIAADVSFATGASSFRAEVSKLIAPHPDVIIFRTFGADAGVFFSNLKELNGLKIPMVSDDNSGAPAYAKVVGFSAVNGVLTSIQAGVISNPGVAIFNSLYKKYKGTQPVLLANTAYDGMNMLALAMVKAHSLNGTAIAKAIPEVENPNGVPVYSFAQGLAALKAGKTIHYDGVNSDMIPDKHHQVYGPFAAYRWVHSKTVFVLNMATKEVAAAGS
jgi:branched-chain amino acid transport system substrate-binding protein